MVAGSFAVRVANVTLRSPGRRRRCRGGHLNNWFMLLLLLMRRPVQRRKIVVDISDRLIYITSVMTDRESFRDERGEKIILRSTVTVHPSSPSIHYIYWWMDVATYFLVSTGVSRDSLRADERCHFKGAPQPGRPHGHQSVLASSNIYKHCIKFHFSILFPFGEFIIYEAVLSRIDAKKRKNWGTLTSFSSPLLSLQFH